MSFRPTGPSERQLIFGAALGSVLLVGLYLSAAIVYVSWGRWLHVAALVWMAGYQVNAWVSEPIRRALARWRRSPTSNHSE